MVASPSRPADHLDKHKIDNFILEQPRNVLETGDCRTGTSMHLLSWEQDELQVTTGVSQMKWVTLK